MEVESKRATRIEDEMDVMQYISGTMFNGNSVKPNIDVNIVLGCGNTPLHYAAACGHTNIVRVLLENGARIVKNKYRQTAVISAAIRRQDETLELFLSSHRLIAKQEQIKGLEIMGAAYSETDIDKTYEYLMRAMQMRYSDRRHIIRKKPTKQWSELENWVETQTIEELEEIRYNSDKLHLESITTLFRVLGAKHPDLVEPILTYAVELESRGLYDKCQELISYAINLRMASKVFANIELSGITQLFFKLLQIKRSLSLSIVLSTLVRCNLEIQSIKKRCTGENTEIQRRDYSQILSETIVTSVCLIKIITLIIARNKKYLNDSRAIEKFHATILSLIRENTRILSGRTLLHLAVDESVVFNSTVRPFPCYRTAELLIRLGASATDVDCDFNTPLHIIAENFVPDTVNVADRVKKIIQLLINAGGHLDVFNVYSLTPAASDATGIFSNIVQSLNIGPPSLKCIASHVVLENKIEYSNNQIPVTLEDWVNLHIQHKPMFT